MLTLYSSSHNHTFWQLHIKVYSAKVYSCIGILCKSILLHKYTEFKVYSAKYIWIVRFYSSHGLCWPITRDVIHTFCSKVKYFNLGEHVFNDNSVYFWPDGQCDHKYMLLSLWYYTTSGSIVLLQHFISFLGLWKTQRKIWQNLEEDQSNGKVGQFKVNVRS